MLLLCRTRRALLSSKVSPQTLLAVCNLQSYRAFAELASHPHVLEVSVVARPHFKWGERPMAFVILHKHHEGTWAGKHDEFTQELKQHARTRLPGFACPEWVLIVEELPVSLHRRSKLTFVHF